MAKRKDDPKLVDAVVMAGRLCANCCYNVAGYSSFDMPDHVRDTLKRYQKEYDEAVGALLQSRKTRRAKSQG